MNIKAIIGLLIVATCSIILNSCCTKGDSYEMLEEKYIPLYENGDTIIFKSNKDDHDTLFIANIEQFDNEISNKDLCNTSKHRESIIYYLDTVPGWQQNTSNRINISFHNRVFISLYGSAYDSHRPEHYSILERIEVDGIAYMDVYNFSDSKDDSKLKILYDLKYGIIRYGDSVNTWSLLIKN